MPDYTTSANMGLTIPIVSQTIGPTYATYINNDLNTIIDQHDHSSGKGVPITPSGLSITSDLPYGGNNATTLRSVRFSAQSAPLAGASDLGCLYESGVDLYYNDGSGNQIRITQAGGVSGTPGSITGLTSPASVTYSAPTFTFQSGVNIAANLDGRNLILRNSGASSFGLTLSPPAGMAADFTTTLPTLPASQSFMTIDASGAMAAPVVYPLPAAGIANGAVTAEKIAAANYVVSSSSSDSVTTASLSYVSNLTVGLTTNGRPVLLLLVPDGTATGVGSANDAFVSFSATSGGLRAGFTRSGTILSISNYYINSNPIGYLPPSAFSQVDFPSAGTYTYSFQMARIGGAGNVSIAKTKLIAYEIY